MSQGEQASDPPAPLLARDDPSPVAIVNPDGSSPILLVGDHAGRLVPAALGTLGLEDAELARHIGWDIGVRALGEALAEALDATFIHQRYSRLVVDCNRDPQAVTAVPPVSDGTPVPGNQGLTAETRTARIAAIHEPYHRAIAAELTARAERGRSAVLISLHSFTPMLRADGFARPWQAGVLHDGGDVRFAVRLLTALRATGDLVIGENEPYAMQGIDHTVPRHAYGAGLPYAELEIRQDLLQTGEGVQAWSHRLAGAIGQALPGEPYPSA